MNTRLQAAAFVVLCLLGAAAAVGLTVREIVRTAPIAVSIRDTTRTGDVTLVTVSVRNTTNSERCVSVRVAARDRTGHDLAATTAARALTLTGHSRRTLRVHLTLTPRQYAEQLHAFYPSTRPCRTG